MEFILSYNNNEGVMVFPVITNGSVMLSRGQDNPTFDGMTGQLQALGTTNLASFSVESIFPLHRYSWAHTGNWEDGWRYVETINAVRLRKIPFRAIYLDDRGEEIFNLPVSVESFEYGLDQARDIAFRMEFREYRFARTPAVESLPKQASAAGAAVRVETQPLQTDSQAAADARAGTMTMRSGAVVSSGRTITIPSSVKQTGMIASFTYWRNPKAGKTWAAGTTQRALFDLWTSRGCPVSNSIATLGGYYLIATTTKFGNVGDGVCVFFENGKTLRCIIGDSKGANVASSPYAGETGNEYGHAYGSSGVDVIEWEYGNPRTGTNQANAEKLKAGLRALGIYGCKVTRMVNLGSWLNQ